MPRPLTPMEKKCLICGDLMQRKRRPCGQIERIQQFKDRLTCSDRCSGLMRRKRTCVVCGDSHPNRLDKRVQVCDKPICRTLMFVHPGLSDPERTKGYIPPHRKNIPTKRPVSDQFLSDCLDDGYESLLGTVKTTSFLDRLAKELHIDPSTIEVDGAFLLTDDNRGIGGCQDDVWSYLSRKSTLIKIRARHASESGLSIHITGDRSVTSVVREDVLNSSGNENLCDIFYAWRCACPFQHTLEYPRLEDLPQTVGWHDACPRCGASPLEVIYD